MGDTLDDMTGKPAGPPRHQPGEMLRHAVGDTQERSHRAADPRRRHRWAVGGLLAVITIGLLMLAANGERLPRTEGLSIAGFSGIPSPPREGSWAPAPITRGGLSMVASTDGQRFLLHTKSGDRDFLPGVDLPGVDLPGVDLPGVDLPGADLPGADLPGAEFGDVPVSATRYGVWFAAMSRLGLRVVSVATIHPASFYQQLAAYDQKNTDRPLYLVQEVPEGSEKEAARATEDVEPWLAAWVVHNDIHRHEPAQKDLTTIDAERGHSRPIGTDDPDHAEVTNPAGTFAAVDAYPYQAGGDTYDDYLRKLRARRPHMPTVIMAFGVPSSLGIAHEAPLGRGDGDHGEREAMRIDADLLRAIRASGISGGFLASWTDDWHGAAWHDPFDQKQWYGLLALDPAGVAGQRPQTFLDTTGGWPVRRAQVRLDEAYLRLRLALGPQSPDRLALGFDVLPGLSGEPYPGSDDRRPDVVIDFDLVAGFGQAYLRGIGDGAPAPAGWKQFERPPEEQADDPGMLLSGDPAADTRRLWLRRGDNLTVRVPWAMLGFTDPARHLDGTQVSPGVGLTAWTAGSWQDIGVVTWANWSRPHYAERLKDGAVAIRDAALDGGHLDSGYLGSD